jgi:hypothetical protein
VLAAAALSGRTARVTEAPPSAFISWAHADANWEASVLRFANALRTVGSVDADLDLWHDADHRDWTTYGPSAIREADFILIVASSGFKERWEGTNDPTQGAGAAREAAEIKAIFERDQVEFRRRVKVILLDGTQKDVIPGDLLGMAERFEVRGADIDALRPLLRSLYGVPRYLKPPLGAPPPLPSASEAGLATGAGGEPVRVEAGAEPASNDAARFSKRLRRRLREGLALQRGLSLCGFSPVLTQRETTPADVDVWTKRTRRLLSVWSQDLVTEFDYAPPKSIVDTAFVDRMTPPLKKALDQRIANLEGIVRDLEDLGY